MTKCGHGKNCSDQRCQGLAGLSDRVAECVEDGLWMVLGIFGSDTSPSYAYTVGLSAQGFPELIIVGLSAQKSAVILNHMGELFVDRSILPDHHLVVTEVSNMPCTLIAIDNIRFQYMNQAKFYFPRYTAMQVVIPDSKSRFPWDKEFNHAQMQGQILLG